MSSLIQNVERYLGRKLTNETADYYSVLGLDVFESDSNKIKSALKQTAAAWNAADTKSEPDSAQQVAKLIRQAQSVLLSSEKKAIYDRQLTELRESTSSRSNKTASREVVPRESATGSPVPASDLAPTPESPAAILCLPSGDAQSPFDPMSWLHAHGDNGRETFAIEAPEVRRAELLQLFPGLKDRLSRSTEHRSADFATVSDRGEEDEDSDNGSRQTSESGVSTLDRFEQMKKKRIAQQRLFMLGIFGAAFLFLGYAGFRFWQNQVQIQQQALANQSKNTGDKGAVPNAPEQDKSTKPVKQPTESQLKIIRVPDAEESSTSNTGGSKTNDAMSDRSMEMNSSEMTKPSEMANAMEPSMPNTNSTVDKPMTTEPMTPTPTPEPPPKPADPVPTPASEPMKMAASPEWKAAMTKAKEAILKADFKTFQAQIELALPLSKSPEMEAKHARLDQAGQLYEIFVKSVQEGRSKTRGTDVIVVGKNKVNIVEVREDVLIVRIQGKNERHPWDKLPLGIALGLAELTLSDSDPTDIAARAIYFTWSPNRSELTDKRAKEWFKKSIGKGQIREDLEQVFTDSYE